MKTAARIVQNCDFDWRFIRQDVTEAEEPGFDDTTWRMIDLPHDWSIEGEYHPDNPGGARIGYLPTGIGWYRKVLDVPAEWLEGRVTVTFDGVFMNSTVWCNGVRVGGRPYGFISFSCDLTPHLKVGRNILAVRVDNQEQPAARWYTGSGIYGHVHITVTNQLHVAESGVFARTPEVAEHKANVVVRTEVLNETAETCRAGLVSRVIDSRGSVVGEATDEFCVTSGSVYVAEQVLDVSNPVLWSPDTPVLYRLVTTVYREGEPVDEVETPVGIRSMRWDASQGFFLNGQPLKLKGVCEHHDGGPVGAAMPDALIERRLAMLKAMGCNAIRTAHNPRTPVFYDLCDRMGFLVIDEIFDGWHRKADSDYGGRFFAEWWQRDVTTWIRRDRNHPCVVAWSIGNETGKEDIHGITDFIHTLDETRPTTGGTLWYGVDIPGFNGPAGVPGTLEHFRAENPNVPIIITEEPHTLQTRGFYRTVTWWRDEKKPRHEFPGYADEEVFSGGQPRYNSSYDNSGVRMCARAAWQRTSSIPWVCGEFRWTGFDYLGEAQYYGGKWPERAWNYGIIDLAGFPKDHFYLYQSLWTDEPMVHILPHWTHPGLEGSAIPVVAYSNCPEVELFLNGRSLGLQLPQPLGDFVWRVPYDPGELKAVAYRDGQPRAAMVYQTAGEPTQLVLEADNTSLRADRRDISVLTFKVADDRGVVVPWAHDRVVFRVTGPVKLLGYENGDPYDVTPHRIDWRRVLNGTGRGFFQATELEGAVDVVAAAVLGRRRFSTSATIAVDVQRCNLRGPLGHGVFSVHYTLDGLEPKLTSPRYAGPFVITQSTRVRVLVVRDGEPFMRFCEDFSKEASAQA